MKTGKIVKKAGIIILAALCSMTVLSTPVGVSAGSGWPQPPEISAQSAVVMEIGSGAVLYEKDSHKKRYPASITKILTTLLAIENCDLNEEVTFSADAVFKNEGETSHISRDVGEKMTLEQCLYAVMLFSANECAYAVAEHVAAKDGGDYAHFIDMMNNRAKEIGCTDTNFHNCNGLPDDKHLTSAYDMALIGKEAYRNEIFRKITGTEKYIIPKTNKHKEETPLVNHHNMLYPFTTRDYLYDYCTGGKTGYTKVAQNTLVTFAEKDGLKLVCVVMKEKTPYHYVDTKKLLNYGFNNFTSMEIQDKGNGKGNVKSKGILNENLSYAGINTGEYMVLPSDADTNQIKSEVVSQKESGKNIASVKLTYEDHIVSLAGITTTGAKVKKSLFDANVPKNAEGTVKKNQFVIKPFHIIIAVIGLVFLIAAIALIKSITAGRFARRHSREMKRMERDRFREVRKRKKYRKKDSLFR